jgi:hypothetical protein
MADNRQHRGTVYAVRMTDTRRWRWEVTPPACVGGLREEGGEVDGSQEDAIRVAHAAIERQVADH